MTTFLDRASGVWLTELAGGDRLAVRVQRDRGDLVIVPEEETLALSTTISLCLEENATQMERMQPRRQR